MEEFVCGAKTNLIKLVKERLEAKNNVHITLGEILIDEHAEEQWISITGGTETQRRETKIYLTTLCNSEDACVLYYPSEFHTELLRQQDLLEESSGACLVFPEAGTVNIYGSDVAVTLAMSALEAMKEKLSNNHRVFSEDLTDRELNEKLREKCCEHDLLFEDYMNASLTVKRTLYRWLSQDMDKSNSLIDIDEQSQDMDSDVTLRENDVIEDPRVKFILDRGYTVQEFDLVRNQLGNEENLSTILTKLLENRQKICLKQSGEQATTSNYLQEANHDVTITDDIRMADDPNKISEVIDLVDSSTDLMVYFEDFFEEKPDLTREEYIRRNLKRQQLLLSEVEKRKHIVTPNHLNTDIINISSDSTAQKKKGKKKKVPTATLR